MQNAQVTIIMPVYNTEDSLSYCVESILAQTYSAWRLLIIDDGSTDNSPSICDRFAAQDKRIKVIHKSNGGVSSARNCGIKMVETPYFTCIDSDDIVEPIYLECLMNTKTRYPNTTHIWSCFQVVDTIKLDNPVVHLASEKEEISRFERDDVMTLYRLWLLQSVCQKLYVTEKIKQFDITMDENLSLGEDLLFNLRYLDICDNTEIVIINKPTYNYIRGNENSLDHKYRTDFLQVNERIFDSIKTYLIKWNVSKKQFDIYYDALFYSYERALRNTFNLGNLASRKEKIKCNSKILRSKEFKDALHKRTCYIHPLMFIAYKSGVYEAVLLVESLVKLKKRMLGAGNE